MIYCQFIIIAVSLLFVACGTPAEEESEPRELEKVLADMDLFDPEAFAPIDEEAGQSRDRNADAALTADGYDPFLKWNQTLLDANAADHSLTRPDQAGPTRTSRAFAMVHIAMYEAANAVLRIGRPYLGMRSRRDVHVPIAVAAAAHKVLWQLYPQQRSVFDRALRDAVRDSGFDEAVYRGFALGRYAGRTILNNRQNDGARLNETYQATRTPGTHLADPLHPNQGFGDPAWGKVNPFILTDAKPIPVSAPPALTSSAYTAAYEEVRKLGGDGVTTPTERTDEQTEIGIFWSYDGTPGLGTPPRLYNQAARTIGQQQRNTATENAILFTRINAGMADAAIVGWYTKYRYAFWRPIVGIRSGESDGNPSTQGVSDWTPLGAPASNTRSTNFTPNFPAYTSGHAIFGATTFRILENFYGTDAVSFNLNSDEFNGQTHDTRGVVRPRISRSFSSFSQAAEENGQSRIYLGIHWSFDKMEAIKNGRQIGDIVSSSF